MQCATKDFKEKQNTFTNYVWLITLFSSRTTYFGHGYVIKLGKKKKQGNIRKENTKSFEIFYLFFS